LVINVYYEQPLPLDASFLLMMLRGTRFGLIVCVSSGPPRTAREKERRGVCTVKRILLVFLTVAAIATVVLATGTSLAAAQDVALYCSPVWEREWHQWWDQAPGGGIVGWWYFWWFRWCLVPSIGWFKLYHSWEWDGLIWW
jgi:hypothetical protein